MNEEELEQEKEEEPSGNKQQFDPAVLATMLNAGENQTGMVTIEKETKKGEKEEPLFTEVKEENKVKPGKITKKLGKYVEKFLFDMKKNPEKYMIRTSKGMMSIEDAMQQGYDPATKDFTDKGSNELFEESLSSLSQSGRENIKRITSPNNIRMPMSAAQGMGIDEESPMVEGNPAASALGSQRVAPQGQPGIDPGLLAALGGGQ
jgi:hypothetical protein